MVAIQERLQAGLAVDSKSTPQDDPSLTSGLNATYHFTFTGLEARKATVVIKDQKLCVTDGHAGQPDLHVTADSQTWIGFLRKERNVVWALIRRKIRLTGPLKLLVAFGKCFPQ